jgi:hypothetical protein
LNFLSKCLFAALVILPEISSAQSLYSRRGVLDLRQVNLSESPAALSGEWEFYMSELVPASAFTQSEKPEGDFIEFPSLWNDLNKSLKPEEGYATYRVQVLINSPQSLALELPHFYSAYELFINQQLISSNGIVGTSKKTSKPQWVPKTVAYEATQDTLDIVIHVSNFTHAKGGIREEILLGEKEHLLFKESVATTSNLVMISCLFILALLLVLLFLLSKKEPSILYLSALCLTWSLRSVFSNRYDINSFFPDFPWEVAVKIEYITLYLAMIFTILFLANLFRSDVNSTFKMLFTIFNLIFVLLTLFFNASIYTQFLPVYLSFAAVLLVYTIYVLIRAVVYEHEGVWLLVASVFLGVILFSYDIISYQGFATYDPIIISVGYLIIFLMMAGALLYKFGVLKRSSSQRNVLTYEDLYGPSKEGKR